MRNRSAGRLVIIAAVVHAAGGGFLLASTPVNPWRPFNEKTCKAALDRVWEAVKGNPLMGAQEARDNALKALQAAEQVCGDRMKIPKKTPD